MGILVVAEHDQGTLKPSTYTTVSAASKIGQPISVFIGGYNCHNVVNEATTIEGVNEIIHCDNENLQHFLAEPWTEALLSIANSYEYIMAPATTFGKNLMPRIAGLLDVAQISDIIDIISEDTFVRPIYAGNAIATLQSHDKIKIITVRTTSFTKATRGTTVAPVKSLTVNFNTVQLTKFIKRDEVKSERPELTAARVVVSGGRGLKSSENFKLIENLAGQLNAAIGASRAAVDAGYVPNDYQVGQTGKIVAPELYIAVGISGAIQHLAGMRESKVIVAINNDEEAPIFQIADYGIVGDLFQIVPELTQTINELKKKF